MQVFCATNDWPDPMRNRFRDLTVAHWETLHPQEFWIQKNLDLAERERWAHSKATGIYCQSDDDCLLRPIAFQRRYKDQPEPWDDHVHRLFAEDPTLGVVAALTTPPWDAREVYVEEGKTEVWIPPWLNHQTYTPYREADGDIWRKWPAVGGIKFIRPEALTTIPDVKDPRRYDYDLADAVRANGYRVGYTVMLPCHHLGHCWSVVGRDSSFNPKGEPA